MLSGVLAGDSFRTFRSIGATGREDSRAAVLMPSLSLGVVSACWAARASASLSASVCLCLFASLVSVALVLTRGTVPVLRQVSLRLPLFLSLCLSLPHSLPLSLSVSVSLSLYHLEQTPVLTLKTAVTLLLVCCVAGQDELCTVFLTDSRFRLVHRNVLTKRQITLGTSTVTFLHMYKVTVYLGSKLALGPPVGLDPQRMGGG